MPKQFSFANYRLDGIKVFLYGFHRSVVIVVEKTVHLGRASYFKRSFSFWFELSIDYLRKRTLPTTMPY
jgi:hypothetical protein